MAKHNLSSLEERVLSRSVSELNPEDFEFLRATLEKNSDISISFENPLAAMFHLYQIQVQKGKVNKEMENFILGAAGPIHRGEQTRAVEVGSSRKVQRPLLSGEPSFELNALPRELHSTVRKTFQAVDKLDSYEKKNHDKIATYSAELASAHVWEVAELKKEMETRLKKAVLLKDENVRADAINEICAQIAEIAKRFEDGQKYRLKLLLNGRSLDETKKIEVNFDLVPASMKKQDIINAEKEHNLGVYTITGSLCAEFVRAYARMALIFNTDEIDSAVLSAKAYDSLKDGVIKKPSKNSLEQTGPEYLRFVVLSVINEKTKEIIGALDGCISASKETNVFYGGHIAVLPEYRRDRVATYLATATFTACNINIVDAERKLNTSYPAGADGGKVNALLECEFASLRPTEIADTLGRLIFHGRMGFNVIPSDVIRYRQPDTELEPGKFVKGEENSVPMYIAVRSATGIIDPNHAKEWVRFVYNGFIAGGMDPNAIKWDWKYALSTADGSPLASFKAFPLPKNVEELERFVRSQGHMDAILPRHYPNSIYTTEKMAITEKPVSLEDAMSIFKRGNQGPPKGM
jgi:hypothetical protein